MVLLRAVLQNAYVQAVLQGLKPCMPGIILATGVFMVLKNCFHSAERISLNVQAAILTVFLSVIYFGSKKVIKTVISPITLILLSALAGMAVYGI